MTVKRVVANISTSKIKNMQLFYQNVFDLEIVMDLGWATTLSSNQQTTPQVTIFEKQIGDDIPEPDFSIEVDNVDEVYQRAKKLNHPIPYEIRDEPWGVRRFFLTDPSGKVLNVLSHT